MMSTVEVRWGHYRGYEGPYTLGLGKLNLQAFPTQGHVLLDIVTQTEGGSPSAVNCYDRMILSIGLLQWVAAKYLLADKLLGSIAQRDQSLLAPLKDVSRLSSAEFKETSPGRWRWHLNGAEVTTETQQRQLFLGGSSGRVGEWTESQKSHARQWVAAMAQTLHQPEAIEAQVAYTTPRMFDFATKEARAILFPDGNVLRDSWGGAVQAAFLSYAANLPAVAAKHLLIANKAITAPPWTKDWALGIIRELAFGPGIAIYPERYDKIRPHIEKHFGVDLPDFHHELEVFTVVEEGFEPGLPDFRRVKEAQQLLLLISGFSLNGEAVVYDLGPARDDGIMGRKTLAAIEQFQEVHGIDPTGALDRKTRLKMLEVYRAHHVTESFS